LEKEAREIEEGLLRSKHRSQFEIKVTLAVRLRDLRRSLLEIEPQVVHFSGHGEKDGLIVEDDELGIAAPIPKKAISGLFELCSHHVECVILNACYSASQAAAINKHINYVIGMPAKINDRAAIEFSVGFYDALGVGKSFEESFEFGCNAVLQIFPGLSHHLYPVLKKRERP
jgi:CHAT domain-containing protein